MAYEKVFPKSYPRCRVTNLPYSLDCLEGKFSETRFRHRATLCTGEEQEPDLPPDRHGVLPQDVVVLDKYAGVSLPPPRRMPYAAAHAAR
jgi:hypothetical protein